MKEFCDTIATSIARYEKDYCWASKDEAFFWGGFRLGLSLLAFSLLIREDLLFSLD